MSVYAQPTVINTRLVFSSLGLPIHGASVNVGIPSCSTRRFLLRRLFHINNFHFSSALWFSQRLISLRTGTGHSSSRMRFRACPLVAL
jgi:hypothetical protein